MADNQRCTALNLSDESKCQDPATSSDGLFCHFHARQCYGLYRGYKIRNAKLDALDADPPQYIAGNKTALRNEDFSTVEDEFTLNVLHDWLFKKYNLLDRVIRARKLHHSRFYSLSLDYGHKAYLDKLTNERFVVLRALERLEKRTAEVLYAQRKWFKWVRERQDEEEAARVKETEVIRKEAKLFKKHWMQMEAKLRGRRRQEDLRRQEAYLDAAYQQRMKELSEEEAEEEWDPIEDAVKEERENFVALMKSLLWLGMPEDHEPGNDVTGLANGTANVSLSNGHNSVAMNGVANESNGSGASKSTALTKNAKKRTKDKAKAEEKAEQDANNAVPKTELNESWEHMRQRLLQDQSFNRMQSVPHGSNIFVGTLENPAETTGKVPGLPADEVERLLEEVVEIKKLLFCRLLLSHAAILPTALRVGSVEELLMEPEVTTADLRDVCLRVETPALQEVRDACADFFRSDEAEGYDGEEDDAQAEHDKALEQGNNKKWRMRVAPGAVPDKWRSKHEEALEEHSKMRKVAESGNAQTLVDFGDVENEGAFKNTKIRVKVCGKVIWNYPSERALARGGWLHFSIIAKERPFEDAIALCRNWQEFWELSTLAVFQYFPSTTWGLWAGDRMKQQLMQLGFIPYMLWDCADKMTVRHQTGSRAPGPKIHAVSEYKNVMCGCIKRNDPISRRFVQYLSMQTGTICLLVRDAKTGKILVKPPEEHLWLVRKKSGMGRASRNEWNVKASVGEDMFAMLEIRKEAWKFGFNEYYDLTIWDLMPGKPSASLLSTVQDMLIKANRFCISQDFYNPIAAIMKTLTRDEDTFRTRDAKEGEETLHDQIYNGKTRFVSSDIMRGKDGTFDDGFPSKWYYTDVDADEDVILFPEETSGMADAAMNIDNDPIMSKLLGSNGPSMKRWILDLESDQESDDFDDPLPPEQTGLQSSGQSKAITEYEDVEDEWEDVEPGLKECINPDDLNCECERCDWDLRQSLVQGHWKHQDEKGDDNDGIDEFDIKAYAASDKALLSRLTKFVFSEPHADRDPGSDWFMHLDREKAKVFKQQWHAAEDGETQRRYQQMHDTIRARRDRNKRDVKLGVKYAHMLMVLGVHFSEHRLVWRDVDEAWSSVSLFFPDRDEGSDSDMQLQALRDNFDKAKKSSYRRTFRSNMTMPKEFWTVPTREANEMPAADDGFPKHWDKVIRPKVAHWFKAGIIGPGLPKDSLRMAKSFPAELRDPESIDILHRASRFALKNPGARFALLRIWSHSHFWPLMLGEQNRDWTSFSDAVGRCWEWKFVPKDMPGSEYSMQKQIDDRFTRFNKQLQGRYEVKRFMVLVMAEDAEQLQWWTTIVTFVLQTSPWRTEVDLLKSFINVDLDFLEALDKTWLE